MAAGGRGAGGMSGQKAAYAFSSQPLDENGSI